MGLGVAIGPSRAPSAAQPIAAAGLFIAGAAMCWTCAAARGGWRVQARLRPLCSMSPSLCCAGGLRGTLSLPPRHTARLSGDRGPATRHRAAGFSGYWHSHTRGQN